MLQELEPQLEKRPNVLSPLQLSARIEVNAHLTWRLYATSTSSQNPDRVLDKAKGEKIGTAMAAGPYAAICHVHSRNDAFIFFLTENPFLDDAVLSINPT